MRDILVEVKEGHAKYWLMFCTKEHYVGSLMDCSEFISFKISDSITLDDLIIVNDSKVLVAREGSKQHRIFHMVVSLNHHGCLSNVPSILGCNEEQIYVSQKTRKFDHLHF